MQYKKQNFFLYTEKIYKKEKNKWGLKKEKGRDRIVWCEKRGG